MKKYIFDNSNLAESYSGTTTPLTFSFAQQVYCEVYKSFCRLMGVRKQVIASNQDMFPNMVVFIGYRLYYNLINWYRLISFLPGYKFNSRFLEKMLGVSKEHNHQVEKTASWLKKYFIDLPRLVWQVLKISTSFLLMGSLVSRFNRDFDKTLARANALAWVDFDLGKLRQNYLSLISELTTRWSVPIANDLAVMISVGLAERFFKKWLARANTYDYLLLQSQQSLVSLDPGKNIRQIVSALRADQMLLDLFQTKVSEIILDKLHNEYKESKISQDIFEYIEKFGDRSPNELKLESITLQEQPVLFITFLKQIIQGDNFNFYGQASRKVKINDYSGINFFKRFFLRALVNWSISSLQRREETRFKRTLVFGLARRVFLQIGHKLSVKGDLLVARDIYYLYLDEIWALIDGQLLATDAKSKIQDRKNDLNQWKKIETPRRIETDQEILDLEKYLRQSDVHPKLDGVLRGVVASRVNLQELSGPALVLTDFDPTADFAGKILVTKQTDPGWVIIFPLLKGLIVERGGMLSHAAIVARELGLPCIIGVENATKIIHNKDIIKIDFNDGHITH
jgi:phosphohistidine swiveling domain-containing protein